MSKYNDYMLSLSYKNNLPSQNKIIPVYIYVKIRIPCKHSNITLFSCWHSSDVKMEEQHALSQQYF